MCMQLLDPHKNIAILFQARSGSHVLASYLSDVLKMQNSKELFNANLTIKLPGESGHDELIRMSGGNPNYSVPGHPGGLPFLIDETDQYKIDRLEDRYEYLRNATQSSNDRFVVNIYINSYIEFYPTFSQKLFKLPNTQFIQLERADVLYSIISAVVSSWTEQFHNVSDTVVTRARPMEGGEITMHFLERNLKMYINKIDHIREFFGDVPTLYYEEFQFSPSNKLRKLFNLSPELMSMPYNKFTGNHKDIIRNIDEVEDFYEQFVNEHKEYFPQYFGKLPHVKIPDCQGRQPRDLSLLPEIV